MNTATDAREIMMGDGRAVTILYFISYDLLPI